MNDDDDDIHDDNNNLVGRFHLAAAIGAHSTEIRERGNELFRV